MPSSMLDSGRSLSIHIYDLAMNVPGGERHATATALVLVALLLVINLSAAGLCRVWRARSGVGA
jgi:phosphate transport system permease protein